MVDERATTVAAVHDDAAVGANADGADDAVDAVSAVLDALNDGLDSGPRWGDAD